MNTIEDPSRYRGYAQRAVPAEDVELTHVGPGTACGEYLRQSWQPVALSQELSNVAKAIRILGEDLVVFRDQSGQIGVLHRHCLHRGASLEYGIIMPRGIKCCYHGWHYDIDGSILEVPSEPKDSPVRQRFRQGAYPATERDGIVFAYFGPPHTLRPLPRFDVQDRDEVEAVPFRLSTPCNWLQVFENTQDPVHVLHLHARSSGVQFGVASGIDQVIDYRPTPIGMMNVQTRRVGDMLWCRTVEVVLPNINQTGAIWEEANTQKTFLRSSILRWVVPVDDHNTVTMGWRFFSDDLDPQGQGDRNEVGIERIDFVGQTPERDYTLRQRQPGDYEAQVSQRPIAVHALEHRVSSDRGVVMLRNLLRSQIRAHAAGGALIALGEGGVATFTQDTVHHMPMSTASCGEPQLLAQFGRRVADVVIESYELSDEARRKALYVLLGNEFHVDNVSPIDTR